jgi:hypothetical protein
MDQTERLARFLLAHDPSNRSGLKFDDAVKNTRKMYLKRAQLAIDFLAAEAQAAEIAGEEQVRKREAL